MLKNAGKHIFSRVILSENIALFSLLYKLLGILKKPKADFYRNIIQLNKNISGKSDGNYLSGVIFSKDRALQLYSFIKSFEEKVKPAFPLYILYKATSEEHLKAYSEVLAEFSHLSIKPYIESDFNAQTKEIIRESKSANIIFFVDDIIFKKDFNYQDILNVNPLREVFSLRLGRNITYSFTEQKEQLHPEFVESNEKGLLTFNWKGSSFDWNYPISLDGHLFNKNEIGLLLDQIEFNSPNSIESNLQVFRPLFLYRKGICFETSRILNTPINKVQNEFQNIYGTIHQDHLLKLWNDGYEINLNSIYKIQNISPHQLIDIEYKKRK